MRFEVRREVTVGDRFFDRLESQLVPGDDPAASAFILNDLAPYVIEAFQQLWDDLPRVAPGDIRTRYYIYDSDDFPPAIITGVLRAIAVEDHYLVLRIELNDIEFLDT